MDQDEGASGSMAARRVAFVLIDGVGDVTIPDMGDMTPLQAAETPGLDAIAGNAMLAVPHWMAENQIVVKSWLHSCDCLQPEE